MKINDYINFASRPPVYTPGTATMWDDDYISKQLLAVHLNPEIDLASRKPAVILSTIDWLEKMALRPRSSILDLGCGPGLYSEILAERGHRITGVDISSNSIRYAEDSAQQKGLKVAYRNQNYLDLDDSKSFDLIIMIFTDFCVLTPEARTKVLSNIYKALKPGGIFCFDFLNDAFPIAEEGKREWEICNGGFWKNEPYLVLQEKHYYPEQNVCLSQHIVTATNGDVDIYRFWTHSFSREQMLLLLKEHGFSTVNFYENILPACDFHNSGDISFCLAGR